MSAKAVAWCGSSLEPQIEQNCPILFGCYQAEMAGPCPCIRCGALQVEIGEGGGGLDGGAPSPAKSKVDLRLSIGQLPAIHPSLHPPARRPREQ